MNKDIPVYRISLPEYTTDKEPDHEAVGKKADDFIKKYFLGQHIAIRCVSSGEHPDKTTDEMVGIIKRLGHDRYDPDRKGDRYENNEGKKIDIFAFNYQVEKGTKMFSAFTWPAYHLTWRKPMRPVRIDIVIIYDPAKFDQIDFSYAGREHEGMRSDGWVFKDPDNKPAAIKAVIRIL